MDEVDVNKTPDVVGDTQVDLIPIWINKLIKWVKQDAVDVHINLIKEIIQFKSIDTEEVFELDTNTARLIKVTAAHGREIIETLDISSVTTILKFLLFSTKPFVYIEPLKVNTLISWIKEDTFDIENFDITGNDITLKKYKLTVNFSTGEIKEIDGDNDPIGHLIKEEILDLQQALLYKFKYKNYIKI